MDKSEVVKIHTKKYWEIINDFCNNAPEEEWYLLPRDEIDEKFLGLRHTTWAELMQENISYDPAIWPEDQVCRFFQIINKEKFLWVKLKYGI